MRVGWYLKTLSLDLASTRYRCFHMARALNQAGVASVVFSESSRLIKVLPDLDALVVVKRLDGSVIEAVTAAKDQRIPVFLDLCDDILSEEYRAQRRHLHRAVFRAITPLVDALVTTGPALSDRLRDYGVDLPPIIEIPDIAETPEVLASTTAYASALERGTAVTTNELARNINPTLNSIPAIGGVQSAARRWRTLHAQLGLSRILRPRPSPEPLVGSVETPKRVVWFGNHGAPHSNFGLLSLVTAAKALRAVHADIPLELVVVSNDQAKFDAVAANIGVPARYLPWTQAGVYDELQRADVALLTGGEDRFSAVKSANRALQALACGTPVIATSNRAFEQLGDCVMLDDFEGGLRTYLRDPDAVQAALEKAGALIERNYSIQAAALRWSDTLSTYAAQAGLSPTVKRVSAGPVRLLFLIEGNQTLEILARRVREARIRGDDVMIMVTPESAGDEHVFAFLVAESLIPTVASASAMDSGDARWLRSADVVLVAGSENSAGLAARALRKLARTHGAPIDNFERYTGRADLPVDAPTGDGSLRKTA